MILKAKYRYPVVLMDPPWPHYGDPNKDQAAGKHYPLMSLDRIAGLPISQLLADRSVLFVWTASNHMGSAIDLMRGWGLHYRGAAFVWVKTRKDGTPIAAQGVRPSLVKSMDEFVLWGSFQKRGRPLPLKSERIDQNVFAPRGRHSEKPEAVQDRIEELLDGPYCELFARRRRKGWTCWGNELK